MISFQFLGSLKITIYNNITRKVIIIVDFKHTEQGLTLNWKKIPVLHSALASMARSLQCYKKNEKQKIT